MTTAGRVVDVLIHVKVRFKTYYSAVRRLYRAKHDTPYTFSYAGGMSAYCTQIWNAKEIMRLIIYQVQ